MKHLLSLFAVGALFLAGCGEKSDQPTAGGTNTTSTEITPANAPAGYLRAIVNGQQNAVKTVDTTSLDKAIQLFNVQEGRNPKDLNELAQKKYIPKIPETPNGTKLVYDANSGTVKVEPQ